MIQHLKVKNYDLSKHKHFIGDWRDPTPKQNVVELSADLKVCSLWGFLHLRLTEKQQTFQFHH